MTSEKSKFFRLADTYARSRHYCFLAEMDLRTEELGYTLCFRPLGFSKDLIAELKKDLADEDLVKVLRALRVCKYMNIPTEDVRASADLEQLPRPLTDRLDATLWELIERTQKLVDEIGG